MFFILFAFASDSAAVLLSAMGAHFIRSVIPKIHPVQFTWFVELTLLGWCAYILTASISGVYRATYRTNVRGQYYLALRAYLCSVPVILSSIYVLGWPSFPRIFTSLFLVLLPLSLFVGRQLLGLFNMTMQKRGYGIRKALIYGYADGETNVLERFKGFPELGYQLMGVITKENLPEGSAVVIGDERIPTLWMSKLPWIVEEKRVDCIFVPSTNFSLNGAAALTDLCKSANLRLKILSPESDRLLRMMRIHDVAGISVYAPPRHRIDFVRDLLKRISDIIGATLLILLFAPFLIATAVAIYIESGRPVIFRQRRSSIKGGKEFFFYKFRSMIKNADQLKGALYQSNESDGALFKIKNDPRMTKVGRFIRKFSIDELPQLFNVIKGDMSLVGPRPLPTEDFEKMNGSPEFWEVLKGRESVKPGITGLWQISGRSNTGFKEMILLDFYYIENQSLIFDLEILFGTVSVVLFGSGAY